MVITGFRSRFNRAPAPARLACWTSAEAALLTSIAVGVKPRLQCDHAVTTPPPPMAFRLPHARASRAGSASVWSFRFCDQRSTAAFPALASPRHRLGPKSENWARSLKKPQKARFRPFRKNSDALYAPPRAFYLPSAVLPLVEYRTRQGGGKASEGVRGAEESDPRLVPSPAFRRAGFRVCFSPQNAGTDLGTV